MNIILSKKSQRFKEGIFSLLNEKKIEMEEEGRTVYNLSVGTPDFHPQSHIVEAILRSASDPENFKYALYDRPFLKEAVRHFYHRRFGVDLEDDEIMTLNGSQEGMAHIALTLCDPGDTVLVPDPGYPIFAIGPQLCDANIETYSLFPDNGYLIDFSLIPEETAKKAKYILVSYPLNPVCAVANDSFYRELIAWATKYNIIVVHDNAYSDIIYGGRIGKSFLSYPGAREIGIEFFSLSKSYNMTGARTSLAVGNRDIISTFRRVRSQFDYGMFVPFQEGIAAALNGPQDSVRQQCVEYEERMKTLCGGLREIGWNVPDSKGTMFVWAPLPAGYSSSDEFAIKLMEKSGVIVTSGTSFGSLGEGYVRMALILPQEKMTEVVSAVSESGILN